MNKQEYIEEVLWQIDSKAYLNEIKTELENHIEDRQEYYTNAGYDIETAEEKAVAHMGSAADIGEEMNILYNYKKHKIISIAGLSILFLNFLNQLIIVFLLQQPFFNSNILSLIIICIIYRCTLHSRGRVVMLLQGIISLGLFIYLSYHFISFILEPSIFIQIITFFIHGIICLTCTAEINSAIKGNPNNAIMKRYRIWEKGLYILTSISTFMLITELSFLR